MTKQNDFLCPKSFEGLKNPQQFWRFLQLKKKEQNPESPRPHQSPLQEHLRKKMFLGLGKSNNSFLGHETRFQTL